MHNKCIPVFLHLILIIFFQSAFPYMTVSYSQLLLESYTVKCFASVNQTECFEPCLTYNIQACLLFLHSWLKKLLICYVFECFVSICVCTRHACLVPTEARKW